MVQFGCDVNAQDSDGWTPLHCAGKLNKTIQQWCVDYTILNNSLPTQHRATTCQWFAFWSSQVLVSSPRRSRITKHPPRSARKTKRALTAARNICTVSLHKHCQHCSLSLRNYFPPRRYSREAGHPSQWRGLRRLLIRCSTTR